jgi:hypothetical protein
VLRFLFICSFLSRRRGANSQGDARRVEARREAAEASRRSVSHEVAEAEWRTAARCRRSGRAGGRARGDGAQRLGQRLQAKGSRRRTADASSPAEVDDRSGIGDGPASRRLGRKLASVLWRQAVASAIAYHFSFTVRRCR